MSNQAVGRTISDITVSAETHGCFRSWAVSHAGSVRAYNEDAYVNRPDLGLWMVADGAGGHQSGEVASGAVAAALQSIPAGLPAREVLQEVRTRLDATHAQLRASASDRGPGVIMATTVVVLLVQEDHFACLWAGDSRAYLLRDGMMTPISRDHSLVQELVDSGAITAKQAETHPSANVITRAVGAVDTVLDIEKRTGRLQPRDRLLLCSDGLFKALPEARITALLAIDDGPTAERLVRAALGASASDNVTALTIDILPLGATLERSGF